MDDSWRSWDHLNIDYVCVFLNYSLLSSWAPWSIVQINCINSWVWPPSTCKCHDWWRGITSVILKWPSQVVWVTFWSFILLCFIAKSGSSIVFTECALNMLCFNLIWRSLASIRTTLIFFFFPGFFSKKYWQRAQEYKRPRAKFRSSETWVSLVP